MDASSVRRWVPLIFRNRFDHFFGQYGKWRTCGRCSRMVCVNYFCSDMQQTARFFVGAENHSDRRCRLLHQQNREIILLDVYNWSNGRGVARRRVLIGIPAALRKNPTLEYIMCK